jgi:serine protease Do
VLDDPAIQCFTAILWIPAFAGMTREGFCTELTNILLSFFYEEVKIYQVVIFTLRQFIKEVFTMREFKNGKYILIFAIVMLSAGFLVGVSQHANDIFLNASESGGPVYKGPVVQDGQPTEALGLAKQLEKAIGYAARQVQPAVVTIFTRKKIKGNAFPFSPQFRDPFFKDFFNEQFNIPREVTNLGSGMIIREDGYILTNHHVVEQADEIEVQLANETQMTAELVGSDKHADLAVIKIDMSDLPAIKFADSDKVKTGQWAIAVGAPFQLKNTVSVGHISATHRAVDAMRYEDFIQTDAAINQGNSGGPLVNIEGKVVGVNTMIISGAQRGNVGIGLAISSNMARRTAEDLIEYGEVRRPWMGVMIQKLTPEMAEKFEHDQGVLVAEVVENSPADKAGLRQGDLIIEFDGKTVESPHDLQRRVTSKKTGSKIAIRIDRAGEIKQLEVTLEVAPGAGKKTRRKKTKQDEDNIVNEMGLVLSEIPPEQARQKYGIRPARTVLLVEEVQRGSLAQRHGLEPGAVIVEVDRRNINGLDEFIDYLEEKQAAGEEGILLLIKQRDHFIYQLMPLP